MKKYLYFFYDLACIGISLLIALYLRNGISFIEEPQPYDLLRVMSVTLLISVPILISFRTYAGMWRYTSQRDLRNLILSITLIVLLSNSLLFLFDRLEVIPRSVPPIHWALCILSMGGGRLLVRRVFGPNKNKKDHSRQSVLIVGVNHVAELYLEFAEKVLHGGVIVEGIIDEDAQLHQRGFHKHKILGSIEQIPEILERFLVHGIHIDQIVLTHPLEQLSASAQNLLAKLQIDSAAKLVDFSEQIAPVNAFAVAETVTAYIAEPSHDERANAPLYRHVKRGMDIVGALILSILLSPLILLTVLLVIIDIGLPVLFWQQRPGRYGKNFRLYKFRTMRPVGRRLDQDRLDHKADDSKRSSIIGKTIRHLRLDELPQLLHILSGEMSFIGPRPLLKDDQPVGGHLRLSVRPGITGWAQIHGGDLLTPEQKLILDLWYIRHMSLWLDIRIALRTLIVMLTGSKPALDVVEQCRDIQPGEQSFENHGYVS